MHEPSPIANQQLRCTHTHPAGNRCGSYALRGEPFCFHHHPTRPHTSSRNRATGKEPFALPVITNRRAIQVALAEILLRVADNTLDTRRAGLLLQCLQTAAITHTT